MSMDQINAMSQQLHQLAADKQEVINLIRAEAFKCFLKLFNDNPNVDRIKLQVNMFESDDRDGTVSPHVTVFLTDYQKWVHSEDWEPALDSMALALLTEAFNRITREYTEIIVLRGMTVENFLALFTNKEEF